MPFNAASPPLTYTSVDGCPRIEKKMLFVPGGFGSDHKYIEVGETFYSPSLNKTVVAEEGMFIPGGHWDTITVPDPNYVLSPAEENVRGFLGPSGGKVYSNIIIK